MTKSIYLECIDEKHYKFYKLEKVDKSIIAKYGRIGTSDQFHTYSYDTEEKMIIDFDKKLKEKLDKGYKEAEERIKAETEDISPQLKIQFEGFYYIKNCLFSKKDNSDFKAASS